MQCKSQANTLNIPFYSQSKICIPSYPCRCLIVMRASLFSMGSWDLPLLNSTKTTSPLELLIYTYRSQHLCSLPSVVNKHDCVTRFCSFGYPAIRNIEHRIHWGQNSLRHIWNILNYAETFWAFVNRISNKQLYLVEESKTPLSPHSCFVWCESMSTSVWSWLQILSRPTRSSVFVIVGIVSV